MPTTTNTPITYTPANIDLKGLKYTMDGGAEGHTTNSSVDEIIHNFIDLGATHIDIRQKGMWAFMFDVTTSIVDPDKKITSGVSLFQTKGEVGKSDISKYGKGIKAAAHCICPDGRMILGLVVNKCLHMAVYEQGSLRSILPNTDSAAEIRGIYMSTVEPDLSQNHGFLILTKDTRTDYSRVFQASKEAFQQEPSSDNDEELWKHISSAYHPYLSEGEFQGTPTGVGYRSISMSLNGSPIEPYSHTGYSSDNAEYEEEYRCIVPYRVIKGVEVPDYSGMYFKETGGETFTFDDKGKYMIKPRYPTLGLREEDVNMGVIHITKLTIEACGKYNETYRGTENNRKCSYHVYRNGACSDTSHIPFEGEGGVRPTDCPRLRGAVFVNSSYDTIIHPGSNKSIIRPDEGFSAKLRHLARHVHKEIFVKTAEPIPQTFEGQEYLLMPDKTIMTSNGRTKVGTMKGGQVRWDRLNLKKTAKLTIMNRDVRTPVLRNPIPISLADVKEKRCSEFRLFTNNPVATEGLDDIHIICKREYDMICDGELDATLLDRPEDLKEFRLNSHMERFRDMVSDLQGDYDIVDSHGVVIDVSSANLRYKS